MHNVGVLMKGKPRCTLQINPADAERLGIDTHAKVSSRTGAVIVAVEVTDALMPGVVSLPHGWGHDLDGVQLDVARAHSGVNSNLLADEELFDPLSGNAVLNASRSRSLRLSRCGGAPPVPKPEPSTLASFSGPASASAVSRRQRIVGPADGRPSRWGGVWMSSPCRRRQGPPAPGRCASSSLRPAGSARAGVAGQVRVGSWPVLGRRAAGRSGTALTPTARCSRP